MSCERSSFWKINQLIFPLSNASTFIALPYQFSLYCIQKKIQLKDFLLTTQHHATQYLWIDGSDEEEDKEFLINVHNGVQKTLPDKSSFCLSLAAFSRTSFLFLSLCDWWRNIIFRLLTLPLQLCCSPCLILSILLSTTQ